ncbi:hypothetical protein GCM10009680_61640 [Streptomyces yatensis]|uniref:Uncharacterized protein n=1 Tax=Streptomyces yatensis TaxID=155177 RepID=A0ABP4UUN4_9ACTN
MPIPKMWPGRHGFAPGGMGTRRFGGRHGPWNDAAPAQRMDADPDTA